jgi:uncharacterized phage protein (TIGR01671 family)
MIEGFSTEWLNYKTDVPLMQYTGLKDKSGIEAYHNDIVENETYGVGFIEWDNENAQFYVNFGDDDYNTLASFIPDCKVIGNIYENPELLTQQ